MPSIASSALTSLRTIDVDTAPTNTPAILADAGAGFLRVLVRNLGPTLILLSTEAVAVTEVLATSDAFVLPVGVSESFPIAPGQRLYAISIGPGGQVSVSRSVAVPLEGAFMGS